MEEEGNRDQKRSEGANRQAATGAARDQDMERSEIRIGHWAETICARVTRANRLETARNFF
ncbi:hypothetical protein [Natrinema halophilum]|uniref:hypothetical protein n=1 Tax=Natrinema halophilum TaxID=1699371 RepID=UPI001F3F7175|nr:hypothetical protein [Natrinema halophilum]UHQ95979.1 hypothetical protein HYG82_21115 [Natrinema halophilum]